jgi:tRNA uridine 5-carboxymethylaminomethyl modification enzyme
LAAAGHTLNSEEESVVEANIKYEGYINQQRRDVARVRRLEDRRIPPDLDYRAVAGLSNEMVERLTSIQPRNLGQAGRIPGVTPAAISTLNIHLEARKRRESPHH